MHKKSISYASRIVGHCNEFQTLNQDLVERIDARDRDGAEQSVLALQNSATLMQMLISIMLT